uniref:BZIP domain-containing protein n=1 Tax=Ditylenchus dipsaci TaxID=166011 RepID=A0A915EHI5_9BILA
MADEPLLLLDQLSNPVCLVPKFQTRKYIRLRKQRAEDELARRNALKKQKKDAKATLQNARDGLRISESEVKRCEQRVEELTQSRHDLLISLKSIINKETERKRQREAEETRQKLEEQQRVQLQTLQLEAIMQQFKNAPLLNPILSALAGHNRASPLLQGNNPCPSPSPRFSYPFRTPLGNSNWSMLAAAYLRQYASQMAALSGVMPSQQQQVPNPVDTPAPGVSSGVSGSAIGGLPAEVYAALVANYKAAAAASLNSGGSH